MVRREVWQELGGLDESFFPLWFEDVDFCRRIRDRGFSLYYMPEAVAKHTGGHSIPNLPLEIRLIYWYRSLLRYSAKHFRPFAFRAVCLAVVTGSFLRGIAESALQRSLKPMAAYGSVAGLAGRGLFSRVVGIRYTIGFSSSQVLVHGAQRRRIRHDSDLQQRPLHQALPGIGAGADVSATRKSSSSITPPPTAPSTSWNSSKIAARFTTTTRTSASPRRRIRPSALQRRLGADPESRRAAAAEFHSGAGGCRPVRSARSARSAASCSP